MIDLGIRVARDIILYFYGVARPPTTRRATPVKQEDKIYFFHDFHSHDTNEGLLLWIWYDAFGRIIKIRIMIPIGMIGYVTPVRNLNFSFTTSWNMV